MATKVGQDAQERLEKEVNAGKLLKTELATRKTEYGKLCQELAIERQKAERLLREHRLLRAGSPSDTLGRARSGSGAAGAAAGVAADAAAGAAAGAVASAAAGAAAATPEGCQGKAHAHRVALLALCTMGASASAALLAFCACCDPGGA